MAVANTETGLGRYPPGFSSKRTRRRMMFGSGSASIAEWAVSSFVRPRIHIRSLPPVMEMMSPLGRA